MNALLAAPLATQAATRIQAAEQMLEELGDGVEHSRQVRNLAVALFDQLRGLHRRGDDERDLLNVAALLHDIGWTVSNAKHHKHSYRLIRESTDQLIRFTPAQVELIANVARYHRKAWPALQHAPYAQLTAAERETVQRLVALLRIADGLDRPHLQAVQAVFCSVTDYHVIIAIQVPFDPDAHVAGAARKCDLFKAVFHRGVEFAVVQGH